MSVFGFSELFVQCTVPNFLRVLSSAPHAFVTYIQMLQNILNQPEDSPLISSFLSSLLPFSSFPSSSLSSTLHPVVKTYSSLTYHTYTSLGLSLCFTHSRLTSIDIFPNKFPSSISLPFGICLDMTGKDIVSLLGEPTRKGGGGTTRIPCWIEYVKINKERIEGENNDENGRGCCGVHIDLNGINWEDSGIRIGSLSFFSE